MKEVEVLEKEIVPVVNKALKVSIGNSEDMSKATEILSVVNKYADTVKEKKESVTKPINAALKAARGLFAPLEGKLEEAVGVLRKAMIVYQTEQKRIADLEAAKIEARIGDGKGKLKFDTAVAKIESIDKPANQIIGDNGSIQFVSTPCFEVVDISKLPVEFLLANEVAIRSAMKLGKKLDGVRYWTEQRPRNSR